MVKSSLLYVIRNRSYRVRGGRVTVVTFSENGTVLSYKLTEGNHIGDGNIWEFCLTDAHFNKFHSAS